MIGWAVAPPVYPACWMAADDLLSLHVECLYMLVVSSAAVLYSCDAFLLTVGCYDHCDGVCILVVCVTWTYRYCECNFWHQAARPVSHTVLGTTAYMTNPCRTSLFGCAHCGTSALTSASLKRYGGIVTPLHRFMARAAISSAFSLSLSKRERNIRSAAHHSITWAGFACTSHHHASPHHRSTFTTMQAQTH